MSATVERLHTAAPRSVETIIAERRQHAQAVNACDAELMALFEEGSSVLEHICRAIGETALPPGVREEARQLADDLADRMARAQRARSA